MEENKIPKKALKDKPAKKIDWSKIEIRQKGLTGLKIRTYKNLQHVYEQTRFNIKSIKLYLNSKTTSVEGYLWECDEDINGGPKK